MMRALGTLRPTFLMALLFATPLQGVQLAINGSFELGLTGWEHSGNVTISDEFALLQEENTPGSSAAILQTVGTGGNPLLMSFDLFVGGMSTSVPSGALADTAFGSLYFGNVPFGTDAASGIYSERLDLFDLDRTGLSILADAITLNFIATPPGWVNVTLPVTPSHPFMTLVVEEFDFNLTPQDSVVALDNLSILVVPEPSPFFTLILALGFSLTTRRRLP
jgi:hypothetical protein